MILIRLFLSVFVYTVNKHELDVSHYDLLCYKGDIILIVPYINLLCPDTHSHLNVVGCCSCFFACLCLAITYVLN